jgi:hypothetical protein
MNWESKTQNSAFFEDVKKIVKIRKDNINIISPFYSSLSLIPIVKVNATGNADLKPYAMHNGRVAIVVAGKKDAASGIISLNIPLIDMNMTDEPSYAVIDLMTDICQQKTGAQLHNLSLDIEKGGFRAIKIASGNCPTATSTTSTSTTALVTTSSSVASSTTSTTTAPQCSLAGDYPPCGLVSLTEVVDAINKWADNQMNLLDVIELINAWAEPERYPPN